MDELLKWRGEFPILDRTTYMISNSLGAMPRGVYDRLRSYADSWAERGVRAWEESWLEMAVSVGDRIAPLIGRTSPPPVGTTFDLLFRPAAFHNQSKPRWSRSVAQYRTD